MAESLFTPDESSAIKSSWKQLTAKGLGPVGRIILHRFYNDVPEVRKLFHRIGISDDDPASYSKEVLEKNRDFRSHAQRVAGAINTVVKNLDDTETVVKLGTDIGKAHSRYGVENHHFDQLGEVLVNVLCSALEVDVSHPTIQAWIKAYGALASTAKAGMVG